MYNLYMYMDIHTVKYMYTVCKVSLSLSLDKLVDGQDVFFIQPTRTGTFTSCGAKTSYNEEINSTQRGINLNMELKRQKSNLCIVCRVKQHRSLVTPKKYSLKANTNWTCRPICHLWHDICCTHHSQMALLYLHVNEAFSLNTVYNALQHLCETK